MAPDTLPLKVVTRYAGYAALPSILKIDFNMHLHIHLENLLIGIMANRLITLRHICLNISIYFAFFLLLVV